MDLICTTADFIGTDDDGDGDYRNHDDEIYTLRQRCHVQL